MNFRQLEIFRAVISGGSASRASELLDISQPAISRSITDLEASLGFPLFNRVRGRLVITPEGQLFSEEVANAFLAMDRLKASSLTIRDLGSGHIRIASLAAMGSTLIPRAIKLFQEEHKGVGVTLHVDSSPNVKEFVAKGQFDIGLAADEIDLTGVDHQRFASFKAVCVLPHNHPLTSQKAIRPEFLHREPFIALAPGDRARAELDLIFRKHEAVPSIVVETPNSSTVCALALEGIGVGIANPIAAEGYSERGLEVRPFTPDVHFKSHLLFRPDVQRSRIVNAMAAALMQARSLPPTGAKSQRDLI
ncbi:LysR substrate-binding domain-containing protein [Phyllobacterium sp. 22229]|uniref:LysR substrate-binding domain-containing protein n=1 Tax=Phyllobacterium TaxID=28100 RepID=UPI0010291C32|nr:LysR substrate-binding domain-containing protein [Phyllobacterium myrsinacearum]RZS74134.1 LysR family transcriptional regulator [Phyllobacterium myrsinacearum]